MSRNRDELLAQAATMEALAEIAVADLALLEQEGKEIIQICGPMSTGGMGNSAHNMLRFRYAVDKALENELYVFDQLPYQEAIARITNYYDGAPYAMEILDVFYKKIFESGYIKKALFLLDWQSSKGATWENELMKTLNIPTEDYPSEWL